jgi:hypothetical protein
MRRSTDGETSWQAPPHVFIPYPHFPSESAWDDGRLGRRKPKRKKEHAAIEEKAHEHQDKNSTQDYEIRMK